MEGGKSENDITLSLKLSYTKYRVFVLGQSTYCGFFCKCLVFGNFFCQVFSSVNYSQLFSRGQFFKKNGRKGALF